VVQTLASWHRSDAIAMVSGERGAWATMQRVDMDSSRNSGGLTQLGIETTPGALGGYCVQDIIGVGRNGLAPLGSPVQTISHERSSPYSKIHKMCGWFAKAAAVPVASSISTS
jgi:hypothetical protein